jgi:hypothetical protein
MAAVLPFLETEEFSFPQNLASPSGLSGLGSAVTTQGEEEVSPEEFLRRSNSEMTRLLWIRTAAQKGLEGKGFKLYFEGDQLMILVVDRDGNSSPVPADIVPWSNMTHSKARTSFFSTNDKMRCPTFDLPAGDTTVGGSCPAAGPAQTTSIGRGQTEYVTAKKGGVEVTKPSAIFTKREDGKIALKMYPEVEYNRATTVCASCYASGTTFGYTSVQLAELMHFAVMKVATENAQFREQLIQAVVWAIPRLKYASMLIAPKNRKADADALADAANQMNAAFKPSSPPVAPEIEAKRKKNKADPVSKASDILNSMQKYPNVLRVHSSGDFFSWPYAEIWIEIARRVYAQHGMDYILWAPTRTQVLPGFAKKWKTANLPPNFVIRPSGYHVGDPAPESAGLAKGTSVLTEEDSLVSKGVKFDHQCGVYDLKAGNKTCVEAKPPGWQEGDELGCRACWVQPGKRINYVAH